MCEDSTNKKKQLANIRYTRLSTLLYMIALYKKNKTLNLICYSNSVSVLVTIISSSIIAPEAYKELINRYRKAYQYYIFNILFHYYPVYFFYRLNSLSNISFNTSLISMLLKCFWDIYVKYDYTQVYDIHPPLNSTDNTKLALIGTLSHWLLYIIKQLNVVKPVNEIFKKILFKI